jgi:hypothetical protein
MVTVGNVMCCTRPCTTAGVHSNTAQGLKEGSMLPRVHETVGLLGPQLLKGNGLARLIGNARPHLGVGRQLIEPGA